MRRQEKRNESYFGVVLDIAYRASRFAARKNKLHITSATIQAKDLKETSKPVNFTSGYSKISFKVANSKKN